MFHSARNFFAEAHNTLDRLLVVELAEAILAEVADRPGAEIIKPAHHAKSVAAEIYFSGAETKPGSFYIIDIHKDNTLSVAFVTRHADRGQSCEIKPIRHNICEKSQDEILQLVRDEILRVNPESGNKREQGFQALSP
jgi:hypothetical protein